MQSNRLHVTGTAARLVPQSDYELLQQIAVGGMAEVYLACLHGVAGFCRYVAVKWLRPGFAKDPEFVGMLIDEAIIVSRLTHAGIPTTLDLGFCDERYYIVEEYVHGRDLRHVLQRCAETRRPLSIAIVCYIVMQLCETLDYVHDATDSHGNPLGIVHRDVSPPNVILSYEGAVKLIDFGIAKARGRSTVTAVGSIKGKLSYMSPEQRAGRRLDRRADIFALGVILYELLTATQLFGGSQRAFIGEQQLVARLRELAVDDTLRWIISKALAWEPSFRYQSAAELHDALSRYTYQHNHRTSRTNLVHWLQRNFQDVIHHPIAVPPMEIQPNTRSLRAWKQSHIQMRL